MQKNIKKISKGYRLRPETHKLVSRIRNKTKTDIDTIIWKACNMYYRKIKYMLFLLYFISFYSVLSAQENNKEIFTGLPDSTQFKTGDTVAIIIETIDYRVFTGNDVFINELIEQAKISKSAERLYNIFKNTPVTGCYYPDSILADNNQREMLKFIKAILLSKGNCFVLNKSLNVLEKKIMKENYITKYSIGRKYYVNENLILEVTDATQ